MGRVGNQSGHEVCPHCESGKDDKGGLAQVGWRLDNGVEVPMYGPCPYCETGARMEFPEKIRPHWGGDGYWQGRATDVVDPIPDGKPLGRDANLRLVRELTRRLGGVRGTS